MQPNSDEFPDFDDNLRQAFRRETELFFDSIVREDRSVLDLLRADYTFVNERLARHYGIPDVYGSHFRRVTVTDEARRGLLGHGSILTVTSHAERTSPVLRGKWVLENLLGMPLPPPPPDVPALKGNEEGQKPRTMREQMEEHRANPVCASCHKVMDPIGFALENFDAVGAWRTREAGGPIDASGQLADGTQVDGVVTLRDALLARPELFVGTLTEKLLTYALGRGVDAHDMPAVRAIVREAAATTTGSRRWCSASSAACRSRCAWRGRRCDIERRRFGTGVRRRQARAAERELTRPCSSPRSRCPGGRSCAAWAPPCAAAARRDGAGDDGAGADAGAAADALRGGLHSERRHHGAVDPGAASAPASSSRRS